MLKTFLTTFWLIFLAELGDKTQLATMSLAAEHGNPWPVFAGAASALVLTSAVGVLAGGALARIIPAAYLHTAAALGFIVIGSLMLLGRF
ncbi:MAG: TMEM165/GDT1 family protein [Bacillota bacterium]|nr:TMEM165/GDT1 family protein [Bacillota bacterium]